MKLQDLKKGDKIYIEYAGLIIKVKVLRNLPENKKILVSKGIFFGKQVLKYNDYNFENFDILN